MGRGDHCTELTREELYAQVWTEPMTKLARRYGLPDRGLAKICTRMGIPAPGRGYWARVQSGQVPLQEKLPKIKARQNAVVNLNKRGHILEETKELQDVAGYIESEMHPDNQIMVSDELIDPLPHRRSSITIRATDLHPSDASASTVLARAVGWRKTTGETPPATGAVQPFGVYQIGLV